MRQAIRGYADGVIALAASRGETSLPTVGSQLAGVERVIQRSDDLRRVLADPSVPLEARRAVLEQLFGSRVGATTMALVDYVLSVDRAPETPEDIAWLAERFAAARKKMAPVGDVVLGTKAAEERADGFATAILATVSGRAALTNLEDELFRFSRIVAGSEELRHVLSSRDYPASARQGVVVDLLVGKATPAAVHLAGYATRVGRPRDYQVILDHLLERVAEESNRRLADVRSAVPINKRNQTRLARALSSRIGHQVDVRVTVDPSVVAGFIAVIGDTVVDATARHQLETIKERLVAPELKITTGDSQ